MSAQTVPNWQEQFPDFPAADLPEIPAVWRDSSWRNDMCPHFETGTGWGIWTDYTDPEKKEFPESERFIVFAVDETGANVQDLPALATDEWSAVLAFLNSGGKSHATQYPSVAQIEAFAAQLAASETFQGEGLAQAFYDWSRDGALLYEGDRNDDLNAAWNVQGFGEPGEEDDEDPDGWRMWRRFTLAEAALLLLVEREAAKLRADHLAACGAFPNERAPAQTLES